MSELSISALRELMDRTQAPYKIVRRDAVEYVGRLDDWKFRRKVVPSFSCKWDPLFRCKVSPWS